MSEITQRRTGVAGGSTAHGHKTSAAQGQPQPKNGSSHALKELVALLTLTKIVLARPFETARLVFLLIHQFAQQAYGSAFRPDRDITDQSGRVILITGGNTGLGKETVLELAKHQPARIYIGARNEQKARKAMEDIQSRLEQTVDIRYLPLDLSSFESIREAAKLFTGDCERLDTLILNAGVMGLDPYRTKDGYEVQLGTNYLGHFLLTSLLLPTLQKTASQPGSDVRVLSISSAAWQMAPSSPSRLLSLMTSTDDLLASNRWTRYGISKAGNILLASELARRYPEITSVSIHPGVILTALYEQGRASSIVLKYGLALLVPFASSEKDGAKNHLWAAGCARSQLRNGEYYSPVGIPDWKNELVHDKDTARRLWEWSEQHITDN
ncbi:oxidoreductase, short-chain dehydrogenase/reductase family [Trichophyton verrucosum HKI 0517]|uniref:Oxidoreductase, short-chain dehydrogenase/reductase family n=1 Tax=Trichophyton verrucosum (strain HKI 0517) TaxID=663202 RepID=D4D8R7_TRIVH|nr:oxidoreductase, short-chain dehydrogenase/reductase family [Trichophyton verrucosum HKI 0517]EFE41760.1 oxidoreductase, short-chain dehydrogenase/reductase family [Trichophyton verrucosum HKI 0517]